MDSKTKYIRAAKLAENIREACIKVARQGFMDASFRGLCSEGAIESAISSMQSLNLEQILNDDQTD